MHDRALAAARKLNEPELLFSVVGMLIGGHPRPPSREAALFELAKEFAARSSEGVSARTIANVLNAYRGFLLEYGDRNGAEQVFAQVSELAARTRDANLLLSPLRIEIGFATLDGNLVGAVDASERLVLRADELGAPVSGRLFAQDAAYALVSIGRADDALSRSRTGPEMAGVEAFFLQRPGTAKLFAHAGRPDEAREALHRLITGSGFGADDETPTRFVLDLLEAAILLRDTEAARTLADELEEVRSVSVYPVLYVCPARLLGTTAALLGQHQGARVYYQQALEACAKIRHRPEIALTRLQLADLLLEHYPDERAEALEHLDFAINEFREMKMQPSLERALRHRGLLKA